MPDIAPDRLQNDPATRIRDAVTAIEVRLMYLRRDIHAHPELAFEEHRTAGVVAAELEKLGIPHRTGIGRTGVVGTIEGGRPGPTLAIRAAMDALPIQEETRLPFASTVGGRMHAGGHDLHTVTLLGAAEVLQGMAADIGGRIRLLFQPAGESFEGAAAMIADGALDGADMALGFHDEPELAVGRFAYGRGTALAAADRFHLAIRGRSGHAAYPEHAVDPVVAAGAFIAQAQMVVSREIGAAAPAVVTIGTIHGGSTPNSIPERLELGGTVRSLDRATRDAAEAALIRLSQALEMSHRVRCAMTYRRAVPPMANAAAVLEPAVAALRRQFGDAVEDGGPRMAAEDFAEIAARVPAFHLRIGSASPGRHDHLHNDRYRPDERCIGHGAQALTRIALALLP